jgi:DNA-binding transcriptional ArsR family regulator
MKKAHKAPGLNEIDFGQAAELLRSLANRNRLMIAFALAKEEKSVSELESTLGIKQPILSQQLADLREAGLVQSRRSSKSVFYSVAGTQAGRMMTELLKLFADDPKFDAASLQIPPRLKSTVQAAVFARVARHSERSA